MSVGEVRTDRNPAAFEGPMRLVSSGDAIQRPTVFIRPGVPHDAGLGWDDIPNRRNKAGPVKRG